MSQGSKIELDEYFAPGASEDYRRGFDDGLKAGFEDGYIEGHTVCESRFFSPQPPKRSWFRRLFNF